MVRAVETHPGLLVSATDPAVGSVVFAQRTAFTVNVNQPVDDATLQGSEFTVNGAPAFEQLLNPDAPPPTQLTEARLGIVSYDGNLTEGWSNAMVGWELCDKVDEVF